MVVRDWGEEGMGTNCLIDGVSVLDDGKVLEMDGVMAAQHCECA